MAEHAEVPKRDASSVLPDGKGRRLRAFSREGGETARDLRKASPGLQIALAGRWIRKDRGGKFLSLKCEEKAPGRGG